MTKCCSFSFLDTKKEADKRIKVLEEELSPTDLPPSTEEESSEAVATTSAGEHHSITGMKNEHITLYPVSSEFTCTYEVIKSNGN